MRKFTALLVTLMIPLWSGSVVAHAMLQSSEPAANAELAHAPTVLELHFSEEAKLAALKLTTAGTQIPVAIDRGVTPSKKITVTLPTLNPGAYEVHWSVMAADDGHITKGVFSFVIRG